MQQYKGKVVVITGASGGVGRATAHAFAEAGAKLVLVARGREQLQITLEEVEALGARALVIPADLADPAQLEAVTEETESVFGPIDIWVNKVSDMADWGSGARERMKAPATPTTVPAMNINAYAKISRPAACFLCSRGVLREGCSDTH